MSADLSVYASAGRVSNPVDRERVARIGAALARAEGAAAGCGITAALKAEAEAVGVGYGTLRRHYDLWRKAGRDAEAVADGRRRRRGGGRNRWLQVYLRYCERDKNTDSNAWRAMMRDWRSGSCADGAPYSEVFSGVGTWREAWAREREFEPVPETYPAGWTPEGASLSTLRRAAARDPDRLFQIAASRQGRMAAHKFLLDVIKTRRGLPVGAIRQWDDVWHNTDVRLPATADVAQPLEFAGYDVASAYKCDSVIKPRFTRADGKRDNLKEQSFRFLFGYSHCVTGFAPGGIVNIVEHGTTAIREPVERAIKLIPKFGGLIRFERSGILGEQVHAGLFAGIGGGNFRMKPLVEASHRVVQNRAAGMLGDRGRDAEHMHESRGALVRYEQRLMEAAAKLPADQDAKIEYGLLTFDEYVTAFRAIEREMMADPEHTLEGWDDRQRTEYALSCPPPDDPAAWTDARELMDMGPEQARAIAAFLQAHPECLRVRYLSRREVWEAGRAGLVRVPLMEMPAFLDDRDMLELTVRDNGTIEFSNYYFYGRDRMIYRADDVRTPDGYARRLAPREKVMVKYNPLVPDHVWIISRESGETIGMAGVHSRVPMEDRAEILSAMGAQSHDLARKIMPVRGRHQPEARDRAGRVARNQASLLGLAAALPQTAALDFGLDPAGEDAAEGVLAAAAARFDGSEDFGL